MPANPTPENPTAAASTQDVRGSGLSVASGSALHPLDHFWQKESGWAHEGAMTVAEGCSEAKLAQDAWNAAVRECAAVFWHHEATLKRISIIDSQRIVDAIHALQYKPNDADQPTARMEPRIHG